MSDDKPNSCEFCGSQWWPQRDHPPHLCRAMLEADNARLAAELSARFPGFPVEVVEAAKKLLDEYRELSGDVRDCEDGGMPHDTLTYRGSLLHSLCNVTDGLAKLVRSHILSRPGIDEGTK